MSDARGYGVGMIREHVAPQARPSRFTELKRVHHAWLPVGVDLTYGRQGDVARVQSVHVRGVSKIDDAAALVRGLGFKAADIQTVVRAGELSDCLMCGAEYGWNLDCSHCLARKKAPATPGLSGLPFVVAKANDELQIAFGWFYVVERADGTAVVDHSREISTLSSLERAGYGYVLDSRKGGVMHEKQDGETIQIGRLAEFVVVTPEKKALWGIEGTNHKFHTGLWGGIRIDHPQTWTDTKAGVYPQFSIGGWASMTNL